MASKFTTLTYLLGHVVMDIGKSEGKISGMVILEMRLTLLH